MSRSRIVPLLVLVVLLTGAGCSQPSVEERQARAQQRVVEWLGDRDEVASVSVEPDPEYPASERVRVETTEALPDADVRTLYDELNEELAAGGRTRASALLSVDGFETRAPSYSPREELDAALWLRRDGRAASATVGSSPGYVVIADPCEVFGLAIDYDERMPEPGSGRYEVRSEDAAARVDWNRFDRPGVGLPLAAVRQLDALCQRYPGTRGWVEGATSGFEGATGGALLDPDDLTLPELVANQPALVDPADFSRGLTLGWDGLRADAGLFARVFGGDRQELSLDLLAAGADRVIGPTDRSVVVDLQDVQVDDLDSWIAVADTVAASDGDGTDFSIDLYRELPEETAVAVQPVLSASPSRLTSPALRDFVEVIYPIEEVVVSAIMTLTISSDISDPDLLQTLQATAVASRALEDEGVDVEPGVQLLARVRGPGGSYSFPLVGTVVDDEFRPGVQGQAEVPDLVERYASAWEQVT